MTTATAKTGAASLKTAKKRIADLTPSDYNPNEMTDAELRALDASMQAFGYVEPVVWNKRSGRIVSGHQRVRCLKARGVDALDVVVVDLSDVDERTLNVGMNSISGTQEANKLEAVLQSLSEGRRALAGWDEAAFNKLLSQTHEHLTAGKQDPNAVPVKAKRRVKRDDVWHLGEHRLLCGDSIDGDTPFRHGERADCVFTSPPYGVGIDYGAGYSDTFENACALIAQMPEALGPYIAEGGFIVVNFNDITAHGKRGCEFPMGQTYIDAFAAAGWRLWSRRVWLKPIGRVNDRHCIQSNRAAPDFEHVWTFKRKAERKAIRRQTRGEYASQHGIIDTRKNDGPDASNEIHGAAMPVELAQHCIAVHSRKKGIVLDPFAGTGTTIIAAEQMQRVCFAVEQHPAFCDIVLARWEAFTGKKAEKA